jgi:hypothetical protein
MDQNTLIVLLVKMEHTYGKEFVITHAQKELMPMILIGHVNHVPLHVLLVSVQLNVHLVLLELTYTEMIVLKTAQMLIPELTTITQITLVLTVTLIVKLVMNQLKTPTNVQHVNLLMIATTELSVAQLTNYVCSHKPFVLEKEQFTPLEWNTAQVVKTDFILMIPSVQQLAHVVNTLTMKTTLVMNVTIHANVAQDQPQLNVPLVTMELIYTEENVLPFAQKDTGEAPSITLVKDVMDLVNHATDLKLIIVILAQKDYTSMPTNVSAHVLTEHTNQKLVNQLVNHAT